MGTDNAFTAAMAAPCDRHDAPAGSPCWSLPVGLCGRRIRASGFRGEPAGWKGLDRRIREAKEVA